MTEEQPPAPRNADSWARKVDRLEVGEEQRKFGYNVDGKRVSGPQQGFGRLWDRTFTVDLGTAVTPEALVADWRHRFGSFWPKGGTFHGKITGIDPGDVAPLSGGGVATGILVIYADDTSFTFMTPEGHFINGMITFSGDLQDDGGTFARIRMLIRMADPTFEAMWPMVRSKEGAFWTGTLTNLAAAHGVHDAVVVERTECVDPKRIWRNWTNITQNGAARTVIHAMGTPFRSRSA